MILPPGVINQAGPVAVALHTIVGILFDGIFRDPQLTMEQPTVIGYSCRNICCSLVEKGNTESPQCQVSPPHRFRRCSFYMALRRHPCRGPGWH